MKTRRLWQKCGVFLVLVSLLLLAGEGVARYMEGLANGRSNTQKISQYQIEDFYDLQEESLALIITGSSHAMCSYDPDYTMAETGLVSYNLGTALQQPDTAYYLMREVYKTQTPKVWVCDLYFKTLSPGKSAEQGETVLQEMKPSVNAFQFWVGNLPFDSAMTMLSNQINPFGRINSLAAQWDSAVESAAQPRDSKYRGNGYYVPEAVVSEGLLAAENHPFPETYEPFHERQLMYLEKTIELAKSHGTEIVFVTAPIPPTILERISYYPEVHRDISEIADRHGIPFLDFCDDQLAGKLSLPDECFADQGHMNPEGAAAFMPYFIEEIGPYLPTA